MTWVKLLFHPSIHFLTALNPHSGRGLNCYSGINNENSHSATDDGMWVAVVTCSYCIYVINYDLGNKVILLLAVIQDWGHFVLVLEWFSYLLLINVLLLLFFIVIIIISLNKNAAQSRNVLLPNCEWCVCSVCELSAGPDLRSNADLRDVSAGSLRCTNCFLLCRLFWQAVKIRDNSASSMC